MTTPAQQEIVRRLAELCELSPGVRFGQLVAHLGFLAEDMFDHPMADIEDDELLRVIDRHKSEMAVREAKIA
jgi:hypothetical protein